jgi:hypothetical protein
MAKRELPAFIILWNKHKKLYMEVFSMALQELSKRDFVSGDEDAISEILSLLLTQTCFNVGRIRGQEVRTPIWEGPIPPVSEQELKGGKTRKRPDFTCKCSNPWAHSPEEYEISLHVECKRLGINTSHSWNLNENYVINGIKRFDCKTHEYGKRSPSGMMIGYIISMIPKEIETEVNGYQRKRLSHCPDIAFTFDERTLFQARQQIQRRSIEPVQFELIHLWVDLRDKYHTSHVEVTQT